MIFLTWDKYFDRVYFHVKKKLLGQLFCFTQPIRCTFLSKFVIGFKTCQICFGNCFGTSFAGINGNIHIYVFILIQYKWPLVLNEIYHYTKVILFLWRFCHQLWRSPQFQIVVSNSSNMLKKPLMKKFIFHDVLSDTIWILTYQGSMMLRRK